MTEQNAKDNFRSYLATQGLKSTRQRDIILDEFLRAGAHLSTEELYLRLRGQHPHIGYATVHRTLKLFAECGIAEPCHFGDGQTRYESSAGEEHHDHLICTDCGAIVEFENPQIEALQESVAIQHGFRIERHRLELYGRCRDCQK
ncbi:MAG: transcriptional repressor [Desulfuromonas sp.]|nr:transcriptional repressor [Desulfuromonas sp.]